MSDAVSIIDVMDDPSLFHPWFKRKEDWQAWRAFLCALFGLTMTTEQREIYTRLLHERTCRQHKRMKRGWWLVVAAESRSSLR